MDDKQQEFLERWERERETYRAWGEFVCQRILGLLGEVLPEEGAGLFLRIPAKPRVKETPSMLQKAFLRKRYSSPYESVEDKVGVRFVVLLNEDVRTIGSVIEGATQYWTATKARDFEAEREENPSVFDYQSVHYVVRANPGLGDGHTTFIDDMPCEIQVRTLLQHAYSELTHDTIYKPTVSATPEMKRAAAKSMALIEATDDYFSQVVGIIKTAIGNAEYVERTLATKYQEITGKIAANTPLNKLLIDHYKPWAGADFDQQIQDWLNRKPYIAELLSGSDLGIVFEVPAVLLVLFAISMTPDKAKENSPLADEELEPLYSILGLGFNSV
ncbi:GTP pyrophosphokinase family protein [Sinorhizobium meliloti]|uniref:GTP pyrophosphokinase n=1 Tax=Rhizobium meliloti TaxID=382 RepID=UPI000FD8E060|nr:RelA/SpoT domain-containing protein [Sinorhizobium meliloti]MDW9473488.1 RelA/SpoT family protein [Sinorhizobium meliloti]RVI81722.1 RelA/SpoT family protein [Sinorhizobium meliloti]RVP20668.1 RelA/SpoT family protein [Sinorhizobium meliloti]